MMNLSRLLALAIIPATALVALPAFAEGSPWLPTPSTGSLSLSYVHQSADKFYRKSSKVPTPGGGEDLEQSTLWLQTSYGLSDAIAVDARLGWARSEFATGPGLPVIEQKSYDGLVDINAGLTWRVVDEAVSELPSIALRAAVIIDGGYTTGYINSLGDGGNGAEASLLVGKFLNDRFALSGELGYRTRNNNIPDNIFFKLSGGVILAQGWALNVGYEQTDTGSGLDIGPGFHPSRFPQIREESELFSAGLSFAPAQGYNLGFVYGTTLDGRNVGDFDFYGLSLDYSFDTF